MAGLTRGERSYAGRKRDPRAAREATLPAPPSTDHFLQSGFDDDDDPAKRVVGNRQMIVIATASYDVERSGVVAPACGEEPDDVDRGTVGASMIRVRDTSCGRPSSLTKVTRPPRATVTSFGETPAPVMVICAVIGGGGGDAGGTATTGGVGADGALAGDEPPQDVAISATRASARAGGRCPKRPAVDRLRMPTLFRNTQSVPRALVLMAALTLASSATAQAQSAAPIDPHAGHTRAAAISPSTRERAGG